jgi:RNA polymerase sigma factor (sigma-70 family)
VLHRGQTSGTAPSDRDLILACRKGDSRAWKHLLSKYERLVFSIPMRYGLSRDDAADVSQLTFTILIQSVETLPEDSRLGAWLATVAKRHTWRLMERNRREGASDVVAERADLGADAVALGKSDGSDTIEHWELSDWLDGGLQNIDGNCRDLLTALYFSPEQPSYADIAARLGKPVGSIGPTRARCLERLKKALGNG